MPGPSPVQSDSSAASSTPGSWFGSAWSRRSAAQGVERKDCPEIGSLKKASYQGAISTSLKHRKGETRVTPKIEQDLPLPLMYFERRNLLVSSVCAFYLSNTLEFNIHKIENTPGRKMFTKHRHILEVRRVERKGENMCSGAVT